MWADQISPMFHVKPDVVTSVTTSMFHVKHVKRVPDGSAVGAGVAAEPHWGSALGSSARVNHRVPIAAFTLRL